MVEKISLKEQIVEQIKEKGTLSQGDLAQMHEAATPPTTKPVESTGPVKVAVAKDETDPLVEKADLASMDQAIANDALRQADVPRDQFGLTSDVAQVTITPEDKQRFLDAFADGTRFVREFSVMGGKVTGMFRCRTSGESRAVIEELMRQAEKTNESIYEHAAKLRYALLHCQLAELNHVARPEWKEPLMSMQRIDVEKGMVTSDPPLWYQEMQLLFDAKMDGIVNVLFEELKKFEKVYWSLVKNAANQDFWVPEASIIE